jgi:hypothetical protein
MRYVIVCIAQLSSPHESGIVSISGLEVVMNDQVEKKAPRPFTTLAAIVFAFMALAQITRVVLRLKVTLQGDVIPMWPSALLAVAAGILSIMLFREMRK